MKKTLRTFVAVEISEAIRARAGQLIAALAGTAKKGTVPLGRNGPEAGTDERGLSPFSRAANVKWVEAHNLHLTLKFLGDVHERVILDVCRAVERGARQVEPFPLEVRGAGAFPNAARPRTVWLGAREGADQMVVLHDRIEEPLAELGYREEHRRFQVHTTIGRVRGAGPGIAELGERLRQQADFLAGRMTVDRVTVFSSTLTPDGPIYDVIGTARLGGG
jgi:RNA 2',3'-cyclic 3'-phosphodiesterase